MNHPLLVSISTAALSIVAATTLLDAPQDPKIQDPKGKYAKSGFPKTAFEYAKLVEPILGVPPRVDLDKSVEIPLYVDGEQRYGNLGRKCDNPSFLGKATVSGSTLQRYEGRTRDGEPLPHVVWVAFGRNSSWTHEKVIGSVQMIGYDTKTGATAFFESSDRIGPWVKLDEGTLRMRGVMPWIDDPDEFNRAFETPGQVQCVSCHQADPFITNPFINAAKIPGTDESVVPVLDEDAPYYVIGGENWDMRTIRIEGNRCLDCHRVGMATVEMFLQNGWHAKRYMPPDEPGSLDEDWQELLEAWRKGPESVAGAEWVIPPARGEQAKVVGDDYPHKAWFNRPGNNLYRAAGKGDGKDGGKGKASGKFGGRRIEDPATLAEAKKLMKKLADPSIRAAFESWIDENGLTADTLAKLRSMAEGGGEGGKKGGKGGGEDQKKRKLR